MKSPDLGKDILNNRMIDMRSHNSDFSPASLASGAEQLEVAAVRGSQGWGNECCASRFIVEEGFDSSCGIRG